MYIEKGKQRWCFACGKRGIEEVRVEIRCCWCLGVAVQAWEVGSCLPRWTRLAGCERIADRCAFVLIDTEL